MLDRRWLAVVAIGLIAGTGLLAFALAPRTEVAPDFSLTSTSWENGTTIAPVNFTLADYRGQVVVLDFMAVACTSCRIVTREVLEPLHAEGLANVTILSIDTWADPRSGNWFGGETEETLMRLQQEDGLPWRHALDSDRVFEKYSASALPKLVIVDPDGGIAFATKIDGGMPTLTQVRAAALAARDGQVQASIPQSSLYGLAAAAGLASFFAPCAIGLMPAYLGVLLNSKESSPVVGGLKVTAGMVAGYAGLTVALAAASWFGGDHLLRNVLPELELVMGGLLVLLGVLMLIGFDWSPLSRLFSRGTPDGRRGLVAFGVGYAVASAACTGPILIPILLAGLGRGLLGLLVVFAVYAASLAVFLLLATFLVAGGKRSAQEFLVRHAPAVSRVSAGFILLGGLYLIWFYATALR